MPETRTVKGFSEVLLPFAEGNFECSSLQPLRYASVYKYSLLETNHMISSQPRYDHFDTSPHVDSENQHCNYIIYYSVLQAFCKILSFGI